MIRIASKERNAYLLPTALCKPVGHLPPPGYFEGSWCVMIVVYTVELCAYKIDTGVHQFLVY